MQGQNELIGIMRLFCDDQSNQEVWENALLYGGFEVFQAFRLVCKTFNVKITSALYSKYLDVITKNLHGISAISDTIQKSIPKANVIIPDGKGDLLTEWDSRVHYPIGNELRTWSHADQTQGAFSLMMMEEVSCSESRRDTDIGLSANTLSLAISLVAVELSSFITSIQNSLQETGVAGEAVASCEERT